jgi:hypothetical protein
MENDKWKMENRFTVLGSFSISEVLLGCLAPGSDANWQLAPPPETETLS